MTVVLSIPYWLDLLVRFSSRTLVKKHKRNVNILDTFHFISLSFRPKNLFFGFYIFFTHFFAPAIKLWNRKTIFKQSYEYLVLI